MQAKVDYSRADPVLREKIEKRQKERLEHFETLKKEHKLNEKAKSIVKLKMLELSKKLQSKELFASEVVSAFIVKALEVNERHNCITQFVPQAMEWAAALDKKSSIGEALGPLHGIPFGVKEDYDIEGMDSTIGFAKDLYKPKTESAALIKCLMSLGAIPFCKTNVPQSLFSVESDNPIYGITSNSLNEKMVPGGSSSGSGCIVAAGGAPFATGSDIGGSLRIPAHMHGVSTLRSTIRRLTGKGMTQSLPELFILQGVPGIITPDVETLSFIWKVMTGECLQNQFDPFTVPIPWNEKVFSSNDKLRIGYLTSIDVLPAFPDTQKTVLSAKQALEEKGHKLVEFTMPDSFNFMQIILDVYHSDHGRYLEKKYRGEPISECMNGYIKAIRRRLNGEGVEEYKELDKSKLSKTENVFLRDWAENLKTPQDLWNLINEKRNITQDILGRMEKAGVDLLLMPSYPYPAVKLDHGNVLLPGISYTSIWNFADFPAGVVKFGVETGADLESYDTKNCSILEGTKNALGESKGMPITVQVIGTPFREELVLKAMMELERVWKAQNQ